MLLFIHRSQFDRASYRRAVGASSRSPPRPDSVSSSCPTTSSSVSSVALLQARVSLTGLRAALQSILPLPRRFTTMASSIPTTMLAAQVTEVGSLQQLARFFDQQLILGICHQDSRFSNHYSLNQIDVPQPKAGQMLVKMMAAGLWSVLCATPSEPFA